MLCISQYVILSEIYNIKTFYPLGKIKTKKTYENCQKRPTAGPSFAQLRRNQGPDAI